MWAAASLGHIETDQLSAHSKTEARNMECGDLSPLWIFTLKA
jgi:hypothetical protein